ncbi:MAG: lipopolysaccharide assembly protein LapA domain-containing protein [Candidatus Aadella gelida]|nr:lipopolysaccharide assembly protein LapA domain-containing protein [Candidatus Aadella gelida]
MLGLVFLLLVFILQNHETVKIQLLLWSFSTSRATVIIGTLITGIIVGWVGAYAHKHDR